MKKIVVIAIMMQVFVFAIGLSSVSAQTMWDTPRTDIQRHQLAFLHVRNEYQLRYAVDGLPTGTHSVRANFWTPTGTYYDVVFENPTKIAYLTCNGTYIFEMLDSNGNTIAETTQIKTTKITNPPCTSYENGGLKNQLNLTVTDEGDNIAKLSFDNSTNGYRYILYKDGEQIGVLENEHITNNNHFYVTQEGIYTVASVDQNGNVIASSDYIHGGADGGGGGNNNGGGDGGGNDGGGDGGENGSGTCDACKWLKDMLACPSWDEYMGELTNAIKNALPPPTNWDEVAGTFVDHFEDYFGEVPVPPTKEQIESNIKPTVPPIDTSVPESSMSPTVPNDYNNGPLETDITSGEQIEIVDESEAFEIYEPNEYINSDPPDTMVFPNDPRNHSDGIDDPARAENIYPLPTPQPQPSSDIPTVEMPVPTSNTSTMPTPTSEASTLPTPQTNDLTIPEYQYEGR